MNCVNHLSKESQQVLESPGFFDKVCMFVGFWNENDCIKSKESLFVFGDNDVKQGLGGQAVIRKCNNSIGIPTKKFPSYSSRAYYTDHEYKANCDKILKAIDKIIIESDRYNELVFPMNGFGIGLSKLPEKAPKTFKFLNDVILECFGIVYESTQSLT